MTSSAVSYVQLHDYVRVLLLGDQNSVPASKMDTPRLAKLMALQIGLGKMVMPSGSVGVTVSIRVVCIIIISIIINYTFSILLIILKTTILRKSCKFFKTHKLDNFFHF